MEPDNKDTQSRAPEPLMESIETMHIVSEPLKESV